MDQFKIYVQTGPVNLCIFILNAYLCLDVLLRSGDEAGTAEPQHDHDGQEETSGQNPPRKAWASGEWKIGVRTGGDRGEKET